MGEVEKTGGLNNPSCKQCRAAGETCLQKAQGPTCWQCYKQKMGYSLAKKGKKRKQVEVIMPPRERQEGLAEMGELVGVARGILGALQELVKVGNGIEEEVQKWVKEDIKYRGGWLRKEEKGGVGPEREVGTGAEPEPATAEEAGKGKEKKKVVVAEGADKEGEKDEEEEEDDDDDDDEESGEGEGEGV